MGRVGGTQSQEIAAAPIAAMKSATTPWPTGVGAGRQVDLRDVSEALHTICVMAWKGRGCRLYVAADYAKAMLVVPGCQADELLQLHCSDLLCGTYTIGVLHREIADDLSSMLQGQTGHAAKPKLLRDRPPMALRWAVDEDEMVRRYYPVGGVAQVQKKVNRSAHAIRQRAFALGVVGPGRSAR